MTMPVSTTGRVFAIVVSTIAPSLFHDFLLSIVLLGCASLQTGLMQVKTHVDEGLGKCDRIWVSGDVDLPLLVRSRRRVVAPRNPNHRARHLPDLRDLRPPLPDHRPYQLVGDGHLKGRLA